MIRVLADRVFLGSQRAPPIISILKSSGDSYFFDCMSPSITGTLLLDSPLTGQSTDSQAHPVVQRGDLWRGSRVAPRGRVG